MSGAAVASAAGLSPSAVREAVGSGGVLAMLGFLALYAALTVAMFPGSVLSLAAGALFGTAPGGVLTVAGATLGATAAFAVGRRLSRRSVEAIAGPRLRDVDSRLSDSGLVAVIVLRLLPLVPFNLLNYVAGATAIRARHYVTGTALGIVPGSFAFAAAGATAHEPSSPAFVAAVVLLAALIAGGALTARRLSMQ